MFLFDNPFEYDYLKDKFQNDHMVGGWFAPYPMLIFSGVILAVAVSAIKFYMKRIPMADLRMSIVVIVPIGILCASFFGKLGTSSNVNWKVWEYFYFWEPGMNLFGGLLGGTATGFAYFWRKHNQRLISMWVYADCIVPNILLAQAIGRWGNLFNHEILGKEVSVSKLQWLPSWIWERCFYYYNPADGLPYEHVVFREPIFLYESIATFVLFLLFTFVLPNLGRWFSKKPWRFNKTAYPCRYNKELHWANEKEIDFFPLQAPIKYRYNKNDDRVSLSLWNIWNKAYYYRDVDGTKSSSEQKKIDDWKNKWERYCENKKLFLKKFKQDKIRIEMRLKNNSKKLKEAKAELKIKRKEGLLALNKPSKNSFTHWWKYDSSELSKLHNDNNYFIVRSGMLTGLYLMVYTILRFVLETRRNPYELSIRNSWAADSLLYAALFIIGAIMFASAQFVAPKKWREEKWLYEKSY